MISDHLIEDLRRVWGRILPQYLPARGRSLGSKPESLKQIELFHSGLQTFLRGLLKPKLCPLQCSCALSTIHRLENERDIITGTSHDRHEKKMDWFKNCRTNVHLTDTLPNAKFSVLTYGELEASSSLKNAVRKLRSFGMLCASREEEIWIFGDFTPACQELVEVDGTPLAIEDRGTLDAVISRHDAECELVKGALLEAIEGLLSHTLIRQYRFLHIAPWTWIFRDEELAGRPDISTVILRLHVKLTSLGALYITTTTEASNVCALDLDHEPSSNSVTLAPSGRNAELVYDAPSGDTGNLGRSNTRNRVISDDNWKAKVLDYLRNEGIPLDAAFDWIPVQLWSSATSYRFMWPASLCIVYTRSAGSYSRSSRCWNQWFAAVEDDNGFRNPLSLAEEWFAGATEREKAAADAFAAKSTMSAISGIPTMTTLSPEVSSVLATSPPFIQRVADQQAAMSGIYPTPPDGLVPTTANLQNASEAATAPSTVGPSHDLLPSSDEALARLQSSDSSNAPQSFPPGHEDLFGDMDFATNEVGEQDFSFFDEPDDVPEIAQPEEAVMSDLVPASPDIKEHVTGSPGAEDQVMHVSDDVITSTSDILEVTPEPPDSMGTEQPTTEDDRLSRLTHAVSPTMAQSEKPLSPFGIRERLLPPPIPASALQKPETQSLKHRRSSTFDPVIFRDEVDVSSKYAQRYMINEIRPLDRAAETDISLPPQKKKPRARRADRAAIQESESEEDSYETSSSASDMDLPPKLPWETKKRKRMMHVEPLTDSFERMWSDEDGDGPHGGLVSNDEMVAILSDVSQSRIANISAGHLVGTSLSTRAHIPGQVLLPENSLPPILELFDNLSRLDLVYIAQIVSEQASSCIGSLVRTLDNASAAENLGKDIASALRHTIERILEHALPQSGSCDISQLALVREAHSRTISTPASARPGQPRPPQRMDSTSVGPDIFSVPPPSVHVQRGSDQYEMLPPALDFWETLSLAPTNGTKDVRALCVFPSNEDLRKLVDSFLGELGTVYENCRLGSHVHVRNVSADNDDDDYEDGLAPVEIGSDCDETMEVALRAYGTVCSELGAFLASIGHVEPKRTLVVYLVNPFSHPRAHQYLCACFWLLCKAYRKNMPKAERTSRRSDVVVQVLPVSLIASEDIVVTLAAKQLGLLAKEVYDRCPPPAPDDTETPSESLGFTAPLVELASLPPKRIGFQLAADPPSNLLHEGSLLHMAYATSDDGQWLNISWVDGTGRCSSTIALCLSGKTFADVAADAWERMRDIMSSRSVSWRVFILTAGDMEPSIKRCWHDLVACRPRKQAFSVTLMCADLDPDLKLSPAAADDVDSKTLAPSAGFLTPVGTPQGTNNTVSPDTSGLTNAPPTPAPSDSVAAAAENDSDAHLIDFADESWGVLYSPAFSGSELARGALFKRGGSHSDGQPRTDEHLPCLGLSVLWTLQVRPNSAVDEGHSKQAEVTLRDVLKMYRNLSVITKAKGLGDTSQNDQVLPVHLVAAMKGAEAVNGFLS